MRRGKRSQATLTMATGEGEKGSAVSSEMRCCHMMMLALAVLNVQVYKAAIVFAQTAKFCCNMHCIKKVHWACFSSSNAANRGAAAGVYLCYFAAAGDVLQRSVRIDNAA